MARRKLTDAELAAMPPEKRKATLAKRLQRARPPAESKSQVRLATVSQIRHSQPAAVPSSESPHGIDKADTRALDMYEVLRSKLIDAGRWNDEGCHGMLLTYCQATVEIENFGVGGVAQGVIGAQFKAAAALKLTELPASKVRRPSRFTAGF